MAKFFRINEHIQSPQLRVLDSEGKQIGVMSKQEALDKAREQELDLVEIASAAQPPVAKIVDFQKFKYSESKKERASKKDAGGGLKELWLSPRIDDHDLRVRLKRTEEFLNEGYKVKLTVKFRGRELGHRELGYKVLEQAYALLGEKGEVESDPKFEGRNLSVVLVKSKGGKKINETENQQINTQKAQNNQQG